MTLPPALVPLRHRMFRLLWIANVVVWLGTWLQNTGAGWLMTSLAPSRSIVAMVQAATIMPVFLLALPGGALADIVDRRRIPDRHPGLDHPGRRPAGDPDPAAHDDGAWCCWR